MSKTFKRLAFATMLVLCSSLALQARADQTNTQGQLSSKDYKFVTSAVQGGTMEVTLGQLAAQKGSDPSVRAFGERMVQDHQKANQELTQLISQKGATVPETSTKKGEKMTEHLQGLSGADFDKAYIKHMVSDHKTDIKEFQTAAEKSDDADLKNWAAKTLPTLQEHLRLAESAEATVDAVKTQASAQ